MKKKKVMLLLMTTMLGASLLYGCGEKKTDSTSPTETKTEAATSVSSESQENLFTVTFYDTDGTTVLSTAEVAEGALIEEYAPEKDGHVFMGWFATPSLAHEFDFTQPVTADTKVFAGALRAAFLTILNEKTIGTDIYNEVFKFIVRGIVKQLLKD